MRPVYVQACDAITAFGKTWEESLPALSQGRSAISDITRFDTEGYPCRVAAEVREKDLPVYPDRRLSLAIPIADAVWNRSRVRLDAKTKIGVYVGAESGRASFETVYWLSQAAGGGSRFDHHRFGVEARPYAHRFDSMGVSPACVASVLSGRIGAQGPCQTISLACASSAVAIAEAYRAIRCGQIDVALCGGVGADVDPFMLAGFGKVSALSGRGISCPFDAKRDGFIVGEGAAFMVLSSEKRNSEIEIAGAGKSLDAHHLTAPDPDGRGAEQAIRAALREAGLDQVDYIQAHGTSTPLNDAIEAKVITRIFGDSSRNIPVSSIKGALGHWIAGAGALGFICAWEAIRSGTLFPNAGLENVDPSLGIHAIREKSMQQKTQTSLINAFAFGGANCSLVLRRVS